MLSNVFAILPTAAMSTTSSLQLAVVAFALAGLIAVLVHKAMIKHNKDSDGKPRFDSEGAWILLAIIIIPLGVIFWAILRFLWPHLIKWGIDLLDWIDTW